MGVKLVASSGGSVELVPTNTASNFTVTVPAVTASMLTDSSGVMNIGSGQVYKDSSGNVGIGTASPGYKLDIQNAGNFSAQLKATSGNYAQWSVVGSAGTSNFGTDNVGGYVQTVGAIPLLFYTQNSERMRIDSSGNLIVGNTSQIGAGRISLLADLVTYNGFVIKNSNSTTGNFQQFLNSAGAVAGTIIQVTSTTTAYSTASDYRFKENVQLMTGALEKVSLLKPVTYTWKEDGAAGQGFIAHELQAVIPDCVYGEKDAVNEDGSIKPQQIDTSFLVATLTAAIQELKAIVDAQAVEISALKGTA